MCIRDSLQPLYVMVMVNVMITNNPNQCITNCVISKGQRCVDLEMEHSIFATLSSCRQSGADECWKSLLGRYPTWFCVWGSRVLWTCWGVGMYIHQRPPAGMYVYGLATTWAQLSLQRLFHSRKEIADTCCCWSAKSKSMLCVVSVFMWSLNWHCKGSLCDLDSAWSHMVVD